MTVPVTFIAAATTTITLDGPGSVNRIVAPVPAATKPGDALLMIASSNSNSIQLPLPLGWNLMVGIGPFGSLQVLRRIVTNTEPASHEFICTASTPQMAAMLLVYRGLDNAAIAPDQPGGLAVPSGQANASGTTAFACPSLVTTSYSDIYFGVCYSFFGPPAPTYTPPAGTTERADIQQVVAGVTTSMQIFDVVTEAVGASGVKTSTASAVPVTAFAASFLLTCLPATRVSGIIPDVPGAIGLVRVGV